MAKLIVITLLVATQARADIAPLVPAPIEDNEAYAAALRSHYTKHEYRIPMRDGVQLHTVAYVPKADGTWPILMLRTPYGVGPYGVDALPVAEPDDAEGGVLRRIAPSRQAVRAGYIFVNQDVRGRLMSDGRFVDVRPHGAPNRGPKDVDESTDTYDTIDFLVKHLPRNNGRVGMWGVSYPGFYAAVGAVDAHPALKAVSPQAPVTDWFAGDDFHHNGAFFLADAFLFYSRFGLPRPSPVMEMPPRKPLEAGDLYEFFLHLGPIANAEARFLHGDVAFWKDLMTHGTLDEFWRARDPRPSFKKIKPAVMTVGGWFDAEDLFGALETYRAFERQNAGLENVLVMGPWSHGGWRRGPGDAHRDLAFGQATSEWFHTEVELPFFERHLRGRALPRPAEATIFETGTNEWRRYDSWPPRGVRVATLYLGAEGALSGRAPASAGTVAYVSDPAHPVPYVDEWSQRRDPDYLSADQRFASRRPDVASWVSEPLADDVALAGPIEAELWVSTTGTDADFVVKLVDVYPARAPRSESERHRPMAGYEQLVRAEVMRGKFRDGLATPKPFVPDQPTRVRFTLPDVSHCFRTGHRIAVQVQSSWFPLVDRNPQRFVDIYKASEADFHAETERVLLGGKTPSTIKLPLLRGTLP
jgi:putative CocE/NonD family hydrolase